MSTTMVTTSGAIGQAGRLRVDQYGTITGAGDPLGWYVAAEDRWHDPRTDSGVRHTRVSGTPVTETRVRVPGGDVVQRVCSVADRGGMTLIEVTNDSTLPVAVAFDRRDLLTERPIPGTPIEGIELGPESFVLPIGHSSTIRVGLAHQHRAPGALPKVPSCADVVKGWLATADRAGRIEVPSTRLVEGVVAARCDIALGRVRDLGDDPGAWLLGLDQQHRMALIDDDELAGLTVDIAMAVGEIGPRHGWEFDAALAAAQRLILAADEPRAARDLAAILARRVAGVMPADLADDAEPGELIAHAEWTMVRDGELLPVGVPSAWRGQSFECHDLPSVAASTVSFAVRWHGERAAVLWQQGGAPVGLSAPAVDDSWRTADPAGEALWAAIDRP